MSESPSRAVPRRRVEADSRSRCILVGNLPLWLPPPLPSGTDRTAPTPTSSRALHINGSISGESRRASLLFSFLFVLSELIFVRLQSDTCTLKLQIWRSSRHPTPRGRRRTRRPLFSTRPPQLPPPSPLRLHRSRYATGLIAFHSVFGDVSSRTISHHSTIDPALRDHLNRPSLLDPSSLRLSWTHIEEALPPGRQTEGVRPFSLLR